MRFEEFQTREEEIMARNKNGKSSKPRQRTDSRGLTRRREGQSLAPGLSPFSFVGRVMDEMDRLAQDFGLGHGLLAAVDHNLPRAAWVPQVEMFERDGELVLRADLPGLSKDEVNVELADGALTIEGERRGEAEEEGEGFYRSERSYGRFSRRLPLPEGARTDDATATFDNGVLEVTMPTAKRESRATRKLEIHGETKPRSKAKAA
jgi:HSP20 family protein